MRVARSGLALAAITLIGAMAIAQGPPSQSAATGLTTGRTWTDADYDKLMKEVGATVGVLREVIDSQNAELTKQNADKMESLFEEAAGFWTSRNVDDAQDWADDAAEHAQHVEEAADAKNFVKAAEHMKLLQAQCAACHAKYRDKAPDGGFRIKP